MRSFVAEGMVSARILPDLVDRRRGQAGLFSGPFRSSPLSSEALLQRVHLAHVKALPGPHPGSVEQGTCRLACMVGDEVKIDNLDYHLHAPLYLSYSVYR